MPCFKVGINCSTVNTWHCALWTVTEHFKCQSSTAKQRVKGEINSSAKVLLGLHYFSHNNQLILTAVKQVQYRPFLKVF